MQYFILVSIKFTYKIYRFKIRIQDYLCTEAIGNAILLTPDNYDSTMKLYEILVLPSRSY